MMLKNVMRSLLVLGFAVWIAILISLLGVGNESVIMVFLLGVLITAVLTSSRIWALLIAFASVMLFNFLFTIPRYTFQIYSSSDLMLLTFFLITAIIAGSITSRLQAEMVLAGKNARMAQTFYEISTSFLSESGSANIITLAKKLVFDHTGLRADDLSTAGTSADDSGYDVKGSSGTMGRLVLLTGQPDAQQELIIQAICTQLGIALERERLVAEREEIKLAIERERQRTTLLRSVAHDLRSPLTALTGAGSLLADSYDDLTDDERRKLASDVSEEIVWLSDLVENILNMTRISEDRLLLQKDAEVVDDVMGEAVKHTERLLRERRVSVSLPSEIVTAPMDGKLIAQVIINLLENAARHTSPDSAIALSAEVSGEWLKVSVSDTGDGVPEEMEAKLFERFVTQEGQIVDGKRGLGLGLAICKTIVEAHEGKIWYETNSPKGSVFSFVLPLEV